MARITMHSPEWAVVKAGTSRGGTPRAGSTADGLPAAFLTAESNIEDEFVAQPGATTRAGGAETGLGQGAGAGSIDFTCELGATERAVVAVRHPSGALTFHSPRESTRTTRGGPTELRFTIPVRPSDVAPATRGIVSKALKIIVVKVAEAAVDAALSLALPKLAALFEEAAWRRANLKEGWLSVSKETLAAGRLVAGRPVSAERSLLLIHGTFSNTAAAFGALAQSEFFERVRPLYGNRIFAFDHFTISRTPDENARMLLEELAKGRRTSSAEPILFDVVTHSRGGLVLRSLVERASGFGPLAAHVRLGNAVLVASPNEGTPLATPQRWEDTVGWMANLLELFPENPFTTGAEFVANGIVWIARHASGDLPGLRAMDGDGEFIDALQAPAAGVGARKPSSGRYCALVANYSPTGHVLQRLLDVGIDQFFGSANDLVVPSEGGWRIDRSGASVITGSQIGCYGPGGNLPGDTVTHVDFFSRAETVTFLTKALAGEPLQLPAIDPAQVLPDRRLLRSGAAGVAAPALSAGRVGAGKRARQQAAAAPKAPAASRTSDAALNVTVVNGDLTFEELPLLLGHYRASKLTGTERVVDGLIGGAMKASLDVGVYPVAPGTHQVFLNTQTVRGKPWQKARPRAVIVVGLGQEGKLQARDLVYTVRQAVLQWIQREVESRETGPARGAGTPIALAATLIGSGGSGVSAGEAAQLIAQGIHEANELTDEANAQRAKEGLDARRWPRVSHLRLVELYLDRATEAWSALKLQVEANPGRYVVTDRVVAGTGPLRRTPEFGYRGADYDFISAQTRKDVDGDTSIAYAISTKRARTEVRAQATQGGLLRELVATASCTGDNDGKLGRTLFQLLVPIEMEAFLTGSGEVQIELDSGTAGIPWELLDDTGGAAADTQPWAIRTKLLRKLRTESYRPHVVDADVDAHVLVIGEPACPSNYPRLPGALAEARAVYRQLASDDAVGAARVTKLFSDDDFGGGPDARSVVNAVFDRTWRIIHVAGHGALPTADGKPGGVVLSNGTFLGPSEIKTMRVVPELVFINCCHLAAFGSETVLRDAGTSNPTAYDRARFASSVAEQLIDIGVRCVIAAGWAVDDEAATAFAATFYESLLKRKHRFIDAVAEARAKAFEFAGNTWAAYQCYGDADWRFVRDGESTGGARPGGAGEFEHVASPEAVKLTLETLLVQTTFQGRAKAGQRERLAALEARWGAIGCGVGNGIAELFARNHAETGDLASAIRWYDLAIGSGAGQASFAALEQRSNLLVRQAWRDVEQALAEAARATDGPSRQNAASRVRAALGRARGEVVRATKVFRQLERFGETSERASLAGSAMKRLALIEAAAGRRGAQMKAIEQMRNCYGRAQALARTEKLDNFHYPATNFIAADLALNAGRAAWPGIEASLFDEARKSLAEKNATDPDFWSQVGDIDLDLYQAVARRGLSKAGTALERRYRALHVRTKGGREWSSVVDTVEFVLAKYRERAPAPEKRASDRLLAALKALCAPV